MRAESGAAAIGEGERLTRRLLDLAQQGAFAIIAERDRAARGAGARRAADAMDVSLGRLRQFVIHDMRHAVDVDAARGDVGRDQDARAAPAEIVERANAELGEGAVQIGEGQIEGVSAAGMVWPWNVRLTVTLVVPLGISVPPVEEVFSQAGMPANDHWNDVPL